MDDNRTTRPIVTERGTPIRTRILLLVLAGLLLLCGVYISVTAVRQKEEPTPALVGSEVPMAGPAKQAPAFAGGPKPLVAAGLNPSKTAQPAIAPAVQPTAKPNPAGPNAAIPVAANPAVPPVAANPPANTMPATGPQPLTAGQTPAAGAVSAGAVAPGAVAGQPAVPGVQVPGQPTVVTAATVQAPPVQSDAGSFFVPKSIPSTTRLVAAVDARAALGRTDPCAKLENYKPFPRVGGKPQTAAKVGKSEIAVEGKDKKVTPPPPPPAQFGLVPPPPPSDMSEGMSVAELPAPPTKPSLAGKMKLVAIVGDRAILAFSDRSIVRDNRWPSTVTLGPGEQFESVSMVDVTPDSVTLEEDGERSTKAMDPLR